MNTIMFIPAKEGIIITKRKQLNQRQIGIYLSQNLT